MDCIIIIVHHGGLFVNTSGCMEYIERNVAYFHIHDTESLCYKKLQDKVEKLCINKVVRLFCKVNVPYDKQEMRLVYEDG